MIEPRPSTSAAQARTSYSALCTRSRSSSRNGCRSSWRHHHSYSESVGSVVDRHGVVRGIRGKRGWRKLHIGVDLRGQIHAQMMTDSAGDDAKTGLKIVKKTRGKLTGVTGDAA
ncbi:MAG: hypothetical protein ACI841_003197 [Planctomycetota bacterium]